MRRAEQLLLLLCHALGQPVQPLRPWEYRELAARFSDAPPSDEELTAPALERWGFPPEEAVRITALAERQDVLARYLAQPGITVITRLDERFPAALRKLGTACPPALFLRGDPALLQTPCLALTGARRIRPKNERFAAAIGTLAARENRTLVSGGAVGADLAAQNACLRAGGRVICFVPDALADHPAQENVLFCSDEGWDLPFSAARALRRNPYIYALGGIAFVAQCAAGSGGSWRGATESLKRGLSEVYIYDDGSADAAALVREGAVPLAAAPRFLAELPLKELSIFD